MIISVDRNSEIKLDEELFRLVPEFRDLYKDKRYGYKFVKWVILYCYYDSPYADRDEKKRKEILDKDIFGEKKNKTKDEVVKNAIKKFNDLQYDPLREQYRTYMQKIREFDEFLKGAEINDPDELKKVQDAMIKNTELHEKAVELRNKIKNVKDNQGNIRGGQHSTFGEKFID